MWIKEKFWFLIFGGFIQSKVGGSEELSKEGEKTLNKKGNLLKKGDIFQLFTNKSWNKEPIKNRSF